MAAGVRLTFEVGQELSQIDQSWKLTCTATQAKDTGGIGVDDDAIFVFRKASRDPVAATEFIHIARPSDMARYPSDRDAVPPKGKPYYRGTTFWFYYDSSLEMNAAFDLIQEDVDYMIRSLDIKEVVSGTTEVEFGEISTFYLDLHLEEPPTLEDLDTVPGLGDLDSVPDY